MTKPRKTFDISQSRGGAAVTVQVTTGAQQDKLKGILADGTLDIDVQARENAAANLALIALLAEHLDASVDQFEIVAGESGENKLIAITAIDAKTVQEKLTRQ